MRENKSWLLSKKLYCLFFEDIIKDVEIRINKKEVCFEFKDGRKVTDELLSDGYKRLLNIVVEQLCLIVSCMVSRQLCCLRELY